MPNVGVNILNCSLFRTQIYLGCMRTPLHIALRYSVNDEAISFLIDKYPAALTIQDSLGRVPLHYACSNQASLTIESHC